MHMHRKRKIKRKGKDIFWFSGYRLWNELGIDFRRVDV